MESECLLLLPISLSLSVRFQMACRRTNEKNLTEQNRIEKEKKNDRTTIKSVHHQFETNKKEEGIEL